MPNTSRRGRWTNCRRGHRSFRPPSRCAASGTRLREAYANDASKDTVFQVCEVNQPWREGSITWDNAPPPRENVSRALVRPIGDGRAAGTAIRHPYDFDVTEDLKRAQSRDATGRNVALYTATGQYHPAANNFGSEGQSGPCGANRPILEQPAWTTTPTAEPAQPPAKRNPDYRRSCDGYDHAIYTVLLTPSPTISSTEATQPANRLSPSLVRLPRLLPRQPAPLSATCTYCR